MLYMCVTMNNIPLAYIACALINEQYALNAIVKTKNPFLIISMCVFTLHTHVAARWVEHVKGRPISPWLPVVD